MLLNLNLEDLAWVLDYVSEEDENEPDDTPSVNLDDIPSNDCVVRASKRLIRQLREQLPAVVMAAVKGELARARGIGPDPSTLELWLGKDMD
jgi:hypothetical protein